MNIRSILCRIIGLTMSCFVFSLGILGLGLASGCLASEKSFEAKREFAIKFNRERLASTKNEVQRKWITDILSSLTETNYNSISRPIIASAILAKGKNGNYGLFVFWIEDYPSVDAVEFRFSSRVPPETIPIPEVILKQNLAAGKDTVVFGSEFQWKATSELWNILDSMTSAKDLEIRLMQAKAPVSRWFPVTVYKQR